MAPPINPPNHPPTHQTIHPPIGGGVSTDFKSLKRIKISLFVQVLLNFYWFGGSPPMRVGVAGGFNWGIENDVGMTGTMWGWQRWHGDDGDDGEDTSIMINMLVAICNFLHVCMCMCVHMCGDTPNVTRTPTHLPPPQSCREPKTPKFNNSWTNWDNSILFEDSLPLNTPELI